MLLQCCCNVVAEKLDVFQLLEAMTKPLQAKVFFTMAYQLGKLARADRDICRYRLLQSIPQIIRLISLAAERHDAAWCDLHQQHMVSTIGFLCSAIHSTLARPIGAVDAPLALGIRHGVCLAERVELVFQKEREYAAKIVYGMCCQEPPSHQLCQTVMHHLPTLAQDTCSLKLAGWLAQHQPGEFYLSGLGYLLMREYAYISASEQQCTMSGLEALVGVSDAVFKVSVVRFAGRRLVGCDPDQMVRLVTRCLDCNVMARRAFLGDFLHCVAPNFSLHSFDSFDRLCKITLDLLVHTKPGSQDDDVKCPTRLVALAKLMRRLLDKVRTFRAAYNYSTATTVRRDTHIQVCSTDVCDKLESCLGNICCCLEAMTRPTKSTKPAKPAKRKHDQT